MYMRISSLVLLPLLAACGDEAAVAPADDPAAELIWCATDGSQEFVQNCGLERALEDGRPALVVRHPDGKFRRLLASVDGQSLLAADGAEQSQSARKADAKGERWEVILGDDRYVVPVAGDAARP